MEWIHKNDYHVHHLDKDYNNYSYNTGRSSTVGFSNKLYIGGIQKIILQVKSGLYLLN